MSLEVEEEEGLVTLLVDARNVYGAPHGNTKLIAVRIRARESVQVIEVIVGIECAITQIIVYVAVQTVAAGFGHNIDNIARAPTILCGEGILLNFELLHVVRRWDIYDAAPTLACIPRTV